MTTTSTRIEIQNEILELKDEIHQLETERKSASTEMTKICLGNQITAKENRVVAKENRLTTPGVSWQEQSEQKIHLMPGKAKIRHLLHLKNSNFDVKESVLSKIVASGQLSSRLLALTTAEEAYNLYEHARLVPQSQTCAIFAKEFGISIDRELLFPGVGQAAALFLRAFETVGESYACRVLKIPHDVSQIDKECRMYESFSAEVVENSVALVPVKKLSLTGIPKREESDDLNTSFTAVILMPAYAFTLADIPAPITVSYAKTLFDRLSIAIDFIHDKGWLHCDVKPGNIFCESDGTAFLGDYGSSLEYGDLSEFTGGGTPKYQCLGVRFVEQPRRFDRIGLVLSLLAKLGAISALKEQNAADGGRPVSLKELNDAIDLMMQRSGDRGGDGYGAAAEQLGAKFQQWIR